MLDIANYLDNLKEKILSLYWDFFFLFWYLLWFLLYRCAVFLWHLLKAEKVPVTIVPLPTCSFHVAGAEQQWDLGFSISLCASEKTMLLCYQAANPKAGDCLTGLCHTMFLSLNLRLEHP